MNDTIRLKGVREGNLKNISLEIPKNKLVVLTGLSGSGKSTLAVDVLYQECQRQYLEAISYQGIKKPDVDSVKGVSPAILIRQNSFSHNPRSSVGTVTNIYTELRMIYEKLGKCVCPHCRQEICAGDCKEETVKENDDFKVYMYCSHCGFRFEKLTRSHFSYNTREGACPACQGMGKIITVDLERVLHRELSLEDGAVDFWEQKYKEYQIGALYSAFFHYGIFFQPGMPVEKFSELQMRLLLFGTEDEKIKEAFPDKPAPKTVSEGRVEGICNILLRRLGEKGGNAGKLAKYFREEECPQCHGERLQQESRQVTVMGKTLPWLACLSIEELADWEKELDATIKPAWRPLVDPYLKDLQTKLRRLMNTGLGYLTLDRQTMTLSGGEAQRLKLSAVLDSELTGVIYIMDEPTVGLHTKDTAGVIRILKELRDLGNTVIVIEHDTDIMEAADYMIDIGPGAGQYGGNIIGQGTLEELKRQESSITGQYLKKAGQRQGSDQGAGGHRKDVCSTRVFREENSIRITGASLYNLRDIEVKIPADCLTAVAGVSGSGKSTLIFEVLGKRKNGGAKKITGLEQFEEIVMAEQQPPVRMKRSNIATYSGLYDRIRRIFGKLAQAREAGLTAGDFSFNSKGGRCENCEGLGYVVSNMLFFEDMEVTCPVCQGRQFQEHVLEVKYKGLSIHDVLRLSVSEAKKIFQEDKKAVSILQMLEDTGLGYLELGQTLTTLSGGEAQRLKLAVELMEKAGHRTLYLIDEPTAGLHPIDVEHFMALLDRMVDAGNTVVVVEHSLQVTRGADWVIELGYGGGIHGGEVIASGTPDDLSKNPRSVTGAYLRKL